MPFSPELEDAYGARIDAAVDEVGGLLPLEWTSELRRALRALIADAYLDGAAQSRLVDAEFRRGF